MPHTLTHMLQSAHDARKKGEPEETVLACLLHDIAVNLIKVDHGWWAAQMVEPYVSEKVSWAIRHHQALRFGHIGCDHLRRPPAVIEPYVSEKVSWAIRHHQALRFFPDP